MVGTLKVGDRVKVDNGFLADYGKTGEIVLELSKADYDVIVKLDDGAVKPFNVHSLSPTSKLEIVSWQDRRDCPWIAAIDDAEASRWVRIGRGFWKTLGEDSDTTDWYTQSGDALVMVLPDGKAYLYRLEAISERE